MIRCEGSCMWLYEREERGALYGSDSERKMGRATR